MKENDIRILITGDFCPINRVEELVHKHDYSAVFNDFIDTLQDNDLNVTDLECPLTESISSRLKTGPHQKAHPACINLLKHAEINLAVLANNHIMDYDNMGIQDTLNLCHINGINTIGVGNTLKDASKSYSVEIKGKKIAFLNFADKEFLSTTDGSFNCNPLDPIQCFYDISSLRQSNEYIILIIHAGNEFYDLPSPYTKKLYRFLIDQGADAIISHHTHAYSGYEIYNSKPIFYGLGNFIYDWPGKLNSAWNLGYVVRLQLGEKIDFEIIPLKQCNEKPGVFHLNSVESEAFNGKLNRLNMIIEDDQKLEASFRNYSNSVFPMYDAYIEPYFGKFITSLRKRSLFPKFMSRRKRLLLLNLIRCESHREVLLRLLKQYE